MRHVVVLAALHAAVCSTACSFQPSGAGSDDALVLDAGDDGDAAPVVDAAIDAAPHDIAHVAAADETLGTADLEVSADATIDTTALSISDVMLPAGVELVAVAQDAGGPELAILRVRKLRILGGVTITARGSRPLVVLADIITIDGVLDAGARRERPGAGGAPPQMGVGHGADGSRDGLYADSGGGGGGFGQPGAKGGDSAGAGGGSGGDAHGDQVLSQLGGGSGGGGASTGGCDFTSPGAGGGALQLYARTAITIGVTGVINAGGGGGSGGKSCALQYLAGTGGGSGGAIFLQAPTITSAGVIAANGGAGGGGASGDDGGAGQDGTATTARATGGISGGDTYGATGGRGSARVGDASVGENGPSLGNAGGGGGGGGRIVFAYRDALTEGTTSPASFSFTF
ncbi:MAG TPA: hypothetical protein VM261_25010 [Kofleriaceae bacterium]|nr:hypothetical protein [Kofleriaceae bacterium]